MAWIFEVVCFARVDAKPANMIRRNYKDEKCTISLPGGFKIDCTNPGVKTIVVICLFSTFFIVMILILKEYVIPTVAAVNGKKVIAAADLKLSAIFKFLKGA